MKHLLLGLAALALILAPACTSAGACGDACTDTCCAAEKSCGDDCTKPCCAEKEMAQCCKDAAALGKECEKCAK